MIQFKNFQKKYGKFEIIEKSSFNIRNNKITFFMGPNGAGKTTLIKCLAGLEEYSGTISVEENSIDDARRDMLIVWDDCPFYDNMTGLENLLIMSEIISPKKKDILLISQRYFTRELINRKVKTYSYGQRKKLALVLQMLLKPHILIMDEISNGLDFDTMKQLRNDISEIGKEIPVILTGHQFSFYQGLVDDVFIINNRQIKNVSDEYISCNFNLEIIYERYFTK